MAANYRHIGGGENRLGRHYSRFSAFCPPAALAGQSLALRKLSNARSNRRNRASGRGFVLRCDTCRASGASVRQLRLQPSKAKTRERNSGSALGRLACRRARRITGSNRAFHPDGELAVARAAKSGNHLQILSTVAATSIEDAIAARGALSGFSSTRPIGGRWPKRAGRAYLASGRFFCSIGGREGEDMFNASLSFP